MSEITNLERQIQYHDKLYYNGVPLISDEDYDGLRRRLKTLKPDSDILNKIGAIVVGDFEKVKHTPKMYSLNDVFTLEQIKKWCNKYNKPYVAEMKLDGLAIELEYKNGIFYRASTRGDGEVGDNVTHTIRTIKNIPMVLSQNISLIVRGEVVIPKNKFALLNGFANSRNAAAGSVRQKDSKVAAQRGLAFYAYSSIGHNTDYHHVSLKFVRNLGFEVVKQIRCYGFDDVHNAFRNLDHKRKTLNVDIDGMVVKINDHHICDKLGEKGRYPNWAIACKFKAPSAITKVIDIITDKGRTGVITPIAILEPIEIAGSIVRRANLFNQDEINRLGVYIGATVSVKKAGDIIPQIERVITDDTEVFVNYNLPSECPDCGDELDKTHAQWKCTNTNCRVDRQIVYACGKSCLDIQGLGPKMIEQLVKNELLTSFVDIFNFKEEEFRNSVYGLQGWGHDRVTKITKQTTDYKITSAKFYKTLGIPTIGEEKAKLIAEIYINPYDFIDDSIAKNLFKLNILGDVSYRNIYNWMDRNWELVLNFAHNVEIIIPRKNTESLSFVFTGKLDKPRSHYQKICEDEGHVLSKSITKSVDYVVAADVNSESSKLVKATKYGIKIISVSDFINLM